MRRGRRSFGTRAPRSPARGRVLWRSRRSGIGLIACGYTGLYSSGKLGLDAHASWLGVLATSDDTGIYADGAKVGVVARGHTGIGIEASGGLGVRANGGTYGLQAYGSEYGVYSTSPKTAVIGEHRGSHGIGVHGSTNGSGSGVYGEATVDGVGVVGTSVKSTGVYGSAPLYGVHGLATTGDGVFGENSGSSGIGVHGMTAGVGSGVYGEATRNGVGVVGASATGIGVSGTGRINGVRGSALNGSGVFGATVWGNGVRGEASGSGSGVFGKATTSTGVYGFTGSGTGVLAQASLRTGTALQVVGKAKFSRSGAVTVAAGRSSLAVPVAGVTTASLVLATAQQRAGVSVRAAVAATDAFTVYLTGNAPTGGLRVAYFVIN